jgi:hypothetical protein
MKGQGTWNHELWQGGEGRKKEAAGKGRGGAALRAYAPHILLCGCEEQRAIQAFSAFAKASNQPCTNRKSGSPCPHAKLAV